MNYYLAIDIGASSGRHILASIEKGKICIEEVYRFENSPTEKNGSLVWDTKQLFNHVVQGLKKCKQLGKIPQSVGIDTWGVDYALLDKNDNLVGDIFCYRDSRTNKVLSSVHKSIAQEKLYQKTGIQFQPFNTIYQLADDVFCNRLAEAKSFLMLADYLHFLLTGKKVNEYTNATTTGLVNADRKTWDQEILTALNIPQHLFGNLAVAGTKVGNFKKDLVDQVEFDACVVLPCTHDTASAVVAVPSTDDDTLYLSSGTWSLLGVELPKALTDKASQKLNYTNEGGYNFRFRYLKNIMGLWLIQRVRHEFDDSLTFDQVVNLAKQNQNFLSVVDVNDSSFLAPKSMINAICDYCVATNQPTPTDIGQTAFCVYNSLAKAYSDTIAQIQSQTGKFFDKINIVGGGCKNEFLSQLTAKYSQKTVVAGPVEATAVGNVVVQMIADGKIENLQQARQLIAHSFEIKELKV